MMGTTRSEYVGRIRIPEGLDSSEDVDIDFHAGTIALPSTQAATVSLSELHIHLCGETGDMTGQCLANWSAYTFSRPTLLYASSSHSTLSSILVR